MTTFSFGALAVVLWMMAIIAVVVMLRRSPKAPGRSIIEFRAARRSLAPDSPLGIAPVGADRELQAAAYDGALRLPVSADQLSPAVIGETSAPHPEPNLETKEHLSVTADSEVVELEAVLSSITEDRPANSRPARARHPVSPRTREARAPRKIGRMSYVVVDEEGRPEA